MRGRSDGPHDQLDMRTVSAFNELAVSRSSAQSRKGRWQLIEKRLLQEMLDVMRIAMSTADLAFQVNEGRLELSEFQ